MRLPCVATKGDKFEDTWVFQQKVINSRSKEVVRVTPELKITITGTFFDYDHYNYKPELPKPKTFP